MDLSRPAPIGFNLCFDMVDDVGDVIWMVNDGCRLAKYIFLRVAKHVFGSRVPVGDLSLCICEDHTVKHILEGDCLPLVIGGIASRFFQSALKAGS